MQKPRISVALTACLCVQTVAHAAEPLRAGLAPSVLGTESPISLEELRQAATVLRSYKRTDQFDQGPNLPALMGKRFEVEIPLRSSGVQNEICPGSPFYSYFPNNGRLEVHYARENDLARYSSPIGKYFEQHALYAIDCAVQKGTPYIGGNAFGAVAVVQVRKETFISLVDSRIANTVVGDREWSAQFEAVVARDLARNIRLRVRGRIGQWKSGRAMECGTETKSAEIGDLERTDKDGCFVRADVESVELVDSRTGEVLVSDK
jgi:hypothetical protein